MTSADSGPEKPENPNFENETRQTRTRTLVKMSNPMFGLAGSETGNEYRTLSNYFSFAKTPMRALPSTSQ